MSADRKMRIGRTLRAIGYLVGAALAGIYLFLMWLSPPPDWQHMKPRSFVIGYIGFPALIIFGSAWLFGWLARRFDHKPPLD